MAEQQRYFWTQDLAGPSQEELVAAFLIISLADLIATLRMMAAGFIREGNTLAAAIIHDYGILGMIVYKLVLMAIVVTIAAVLLPRRRSAARGILWTGIIITGIVLLRQLAIMLQIAI
jgi:hypothetical protein